MRTLKFRFWSKVTYSMSPSISLEDLCYEQFDGELKSMSERYVDSMQFTGMFDKHGFEIYEKDILQFDVMTPVGLIQEKGIMEWNPSMVQFGVTVHTNIKSLPDHMVIKESERGKPEIIGNVYQHPHLLRNDKQA